MHSVANGLRALETEAGPQDWVLVHDAARPCLQRRDLDRLIAELGQDEIGGLLAVPIGDTVKRTDDAMRAIATIGREGLWAAQTPQMFRYEVLRRALEHCARSGIAATDESAAIEALGLRPRLVAGSTSNIKVTRDEDLVLAEAILQASAS
jgi:2-C-methyl-D-erythritol 4-phosphate cytidylyltransferase